MAINIRNVSDLIAEDLYSVQPSEITDAERDVAREIMNMLYGYATGTIEMEETLEELEGITFFEKIITVLSLYCYRFI